MENLKIEKYIGCSIKKLMFHNVPSDGTLNIINDTVKRIFLNLITVMHIYFSPREHFPREMPVKTALGHPVLYYLYTYTLMRPSVLKTKTSI